MAEKPRLSIQHNAARGHAWWAVDMVRQIEGYECPPTVRTEGVNLVPDAIPWPRSFCVTLDHSDNWPLEQAWVVRNIAHWCQQTCQGRWHFGEMDNIYFELEVDAALFWMTHAGR